MFRTNAALIGLRRTATVLTAPGVWWLEEQCRWKRINSWPVSPGDDPYYSSVILLLQMDGANGSTSFPDTSSAARTVTVVGNTQISTAQSVFGGSSALFDGNGDSLSLAASSAWDLYNVDFTVELFMRKVAHGALGYSSTIISQGEGTWRLQSNSNGKLEWVITGGANIVSSNALSLNTWYHVAVARSGSTTKIFVDGVEVASGTINIPSSTTDVLYIGRNIALSNWDYNGYMDSLRVTKGVARYTSNFTPPSNPFPNS